MKNVIDKIQKLLSLSSSDNPNESALALSKAKIYKNLGMFNKVQVTKFEFLKLIEKDHFM